jgi:hypothetical protein
VDRVGVAGGVGEGEVLLVVVGVGEVHHVEVGLGGGFEQVLEHG